MPLRQVTFTPSPGALGQGARKGHPPLPQDGNRCDPGGIVRRAPRARAALWAPSPPSPPPESPPPSAHTPAQSWKGLGHVGQSLPPLPAGNSSGPGEKGGVPQPASCPAECRGRLDPCLMAAQLVPESLVFRCQRVQKQLPNDPWTGLSPQPHMAQEPVTKTDSLVPRPSGTFLSNPEA